MPSLQQSQYSVIHNNKIVTKFDSRDVQQLLEIMELAGAEELIAKLTKTELSYRKEIKSDRFRWWIDTLQNIKKNAVDKKAGQNGKDIFGNEIND